MRRWVCIVALLAGFASDSPFRAARLREPVPLEQAFAADPASRPAAWWSAWSSPSTWPAVAEAAWALRPAFGS